MQIKAVGIGIAAVTVLIVMLVLGVSAMIVIWLFIFLAVAAGYYVYTERQVRGEISKERQQLATQKQLDLEAENKKSAQKESFPEERKYRPVPLFKPLPPPAALSHSINSDLLREEHSRLSGEQVFERLRKHTRAR